MRGGVWDIVETERFASPELLARAREGDGDSFSALCRPFQERLLRQAYALCRNESQAKDLTQETLVSAWRSIGRFNGKCQFSTWLCSILLHRHKSWLRRSSWMRLLDPFHLGANETELQLEEATPSPDQAAQLSDRAQTILLSLTRLPSKQHEVIFLRFYADETIEGISAALNCSEGTVKSRLFHALANLRKLRTFQEDLR